MIYVQYKQTKPQSKTVHTLTLLQASKEGLKPSKSDQLVRPYRYI